MNAEAIVRLGEKIQLPNKRRLPLHDHPEGGKFAVWQEGGQLRGWRDGVEFQPTGKDAELYILLVLQSQREQKKK